MRYARSAVFVVLALCISSCQTHEPQPRMLERVSIDDTNFEEIRFRNTAQDLELAGMLFMPKGQGPFPAAVIIHGSGTSSRRNGWYLTLAKYLQDNSIAVLLPDKRGSEQSEGDWRTASFDDLAGDTLAAIDFLRSREEIDSSGIGAIGMSQGGHIVPVVAVRSANLAFVVNMVGSALPMHDGLVYEEKHNINEMGIPFMLAGLLAYPAAWSIIHVRQRAFWNAIGNFDPAPYWEKVSVPALVLYGENDTNVHSEASASLLNSLGNPNIAVEVYPGSGHALESPLGEGNNIIREDALRDISAFIHGAL
jgi:dienelactone hydrolase